MWEQPSELFLAAPGLLPFAVLGQTDDRAVLLEQVAAAITAIPELKVKANLMASTAILASLVLRKELVQSVLRREIMRESPIYQDILREGREEGIKQVAINLLNSDLPIAQIAQFTGLSIEQV
ncbi:MAG: hypothetical protein Kow00121_11370 [Elainellaceae cyanobacterium]